MTTSFDARSIREKSPTEPDHQEVKTEPVAELIEIGRVSDTKGAWLGNKLDTGSGYTYY